MINYKRQKKRSLAFKNALTTQFANYLYDKEQSDIFGKNNKSCNPNLSKEEMNELAIYTIGAIKSLNPAISNTELGKVINKIDVLPDDLDFITFEGNTYPCRYIWFWHDWYLIATRDLEKKLLTKDFGVYVSNEAEQLDEQILYFVEPDKIFQTKRDLFKALKSNIF